jgi:hypothetical protein
VGLMPRMCARTRRIRGTRARDVRDLRFRTETRDKESCHTNSDKYLPSSTESYDSDVTFSL